MKPLSLSLIILTLGLGPVLADQADREPTHPEFPAEVMGWGMAAFFGGRAECRIRKTPVSVTLVDATCSRMLPRVSADHWHNVTSSLVYSAVGPDVTDVMVAGRWIVRRRRLTMAPARTIRRDVDRAARTLLRQLTR